MMVDLRALADRLHPGVWASLLIYAENGRVMFDAFDPEQAVPLLAAALQQALAQEGIHRLRMEARMRECGFEQWVGDQG